MTRRTATPESAVLSGCLNLLRACGVLAWRTNNHGTYDLKKQVYHTFHGLKGVSDILSILHNPLPKNPDRLCAATHHVSYARFESLSGKLLACECKSEHGKLSPDQKWFGAEVERRGGIFVCARRVADLESVLRELGYLR